MENKVAKPSMEEVEKEMVPSGATEEMPAVVTKASRKRAGKIRFRFSEPEKEKPKKRKRKNKTKDVAQESKESAKAAKKPDKAAKKSAKKSEKQDNASKEIEEPQEKASSTKGNIGEDESLRMNLARLREDSPRDCLSKPKQDANWTPGFSNLRKKTQKTPKRQRKKRSRKKRHARK